MDIRVLKYFCTVVREGNISLAAEALHISQPPLSRQLQELEEELGKKLFIRGGRKISLTPEGLLLFQRAEEILQLFDKTKEEISSAQAVIGGRVNIGVAQTHGMRVLAKAIMAVQNHHPHVFFEISDGDGYDVLERLDAGLLDFGLVLEPIDIQNYYYFRLPVKDKWGVLMRKDAPLAQREAICPEDLWKEPLIVSRQFGNHNELAGWLKKDVQSLNIVAAYSLLYNASILVEEGMGYALCIDRLINFSEDYPLCFRPLSPPMEVEQLLVWKKSRPLSRAAEVFLNTLQVKGGE